MSEKVKVFEATNQLAVAAQAALELLRNSQHAAVEQYQAASRLEKVLIQRAQEQEQLRQKAEAEARLAADLAKMAAALPDVGAEEPSKPEQEKSEAPAQPPVDVPPEPPAEPPVEKPREETPKPKRPSRGGVKKPKDAAPPAPPVLVEAPKPPEPEPVIIEVKPEPAPIVEPAAVAVIEEKPAAQEPPAPKPPPAPAPAAPEIRVLRPGDRVAAPPRPTITPAGEVRTLRPGDRVAAPPRPDIRPAGVQRTLRPQPGGGRMGGPRPAGPRPAAGGPGARPDFRAAGTGPRPAGGPGGPRPGGFGPRPAGPGGPGRPGMGGPGRPGMGGGPGRFGGGRVETAGPSEKERVSNYDPNRSSHSSQRRRGEGGGNQKSKRELFLQNMRQIGDAGDDRHQRGRRKGGASSRAIPLIKIEAAVVTTETVAIKDLAEKIGKPAAAIIKHLFSMGTMATINQDIDFDTAAIIASEFGVELTQKLVQTAEETLLAEEDFEDDEDVRFSRPPVVTVMGHVDHGKTSILDAIRAAKVASGEAGGITQHIGAYQVEINGRAISFLDTPGHEAFTAMRARGAQVTDIAVLVVAADDGIMPQTVEAINHAKAAKVPIIVAANKIDKPQANITNVMQALTQYELVPEEWGGDTIVAPVSAVTGEGLDNLLEMILLTADVQDLRANPNRNAKGTIIEAQLDRGRGPVATVLVQNGTLRLGDTVVAGTAYGRVRAMMDDRGQRVTEAGPSMPVEVLGFSEVPAAGDVLFAAEEDKLSRAVAEERREKQRREQFKMQSRASLDDLFEKISQGDVRELNLIIKADVQGSVEAVCQAMNKLTNDKVRVNIVHAGVGAIREQDVMLAMTASAIIIGFNVRPENSARAEAEREKVDIRLYRVIYQAIEDVENAMKGLLAPVFKETLLGHAEVRNVFKVTGSGTIAGSYVTDGHITRSAQLRLLRDLVVIHEGKVGSLRRFKDDVREVQTNFECGISIEGYSDIKEGDVIEAFVVEEVKPE